MLIKKMKMLIKMVKKMILKAKEFAEAAIMPAAAFH